MVPEIVADQVLDNLKQTGDDLGKNLDQESLEAVKEFDESIYPDTTTDNMAPEKEDDQKDSSVCGGIAQTGI